MRHSPCLLTCYLPPPQILEHKPNAILVSTNAPQAKQIKDDMEKISQYTESE